MSRPNSALFLSVILSRHSDELGTSGEPDEGAKQSATRSFAADHINAVIRVYDEAGNVIETHEHAGDFKAW